MDENEKQEMSKFQMCFAVLILGCLIGILVVTGAIMIPWVLALLIVAILLLGLAVINLAAFNKLVSVFPAIFAGVKNMKSFFKGGGDGTKSGPGNGEPPHPV